MDHRDYQAFESLASTLHFGRSARALAMSPSALTRRVQALEEELGVPLLVRDNKAVQLTAGGEIFRRFVRSQLDQFEELKNELRAEQASPTGELLVACTVTACHTVLPRLLARFRNEYPGITLRLVTQDAARSLAQLEAGEVDLAVIPTEADGVPGLEARVLGSTEFALIAPNEAPELADALAASPPRLDALPFVAPSRGLERDRLSAWLKKLKVSPRIVADVRGNEGIIAMVSLGSGVALVPRLVLESSSLREKVREIEGLTLPQGYDVSLCARPRSLTRRVVAAFWDLARQGESAPDWKNSVGS